MSIPDGWQPPPCRHGAKPIVEQEFMYVDSGGTYVDKVPVRQTLWYECPTPWECSKEQRELASQAYDEAPP